MKISMDLLRLNRNLIICAIATTVQSAILAEIFDAYTHYESTTIVVAASFVTYIVIFIILFWHDYRERHSKMTHSQINFEILAVLQSMILGEVIYVIIRWLSHFYLLEAELDPYAAAIVSKVASDVAFTVFVSAFLKKLGIF